MLLNIVRCNFVGATADELNMIDTWKVLSCHHNKNMEMFGKFAIHEKFKPTGTAYLALFSEDEQHRRFSFLICYGTW